jgi:hypothetical protein
VRLSVALPSRQAPTNSLLALLQSAFVDCADDARRTKQQNVGTRAARATSFSVLTFIASPFSVYPEGQQRYHGLQPINATIRLKMAGAFFDFRRKPLECAH